LAWAFIAATIAGESLQATYLLDHILTICSRSKWTRPTLQVYR
jgi:hypothetical protein